MLEAALQFFVPNPAGAFWIGAIVAFVLMGDLDALLSKRNLVLAALLVQAVLLLEVIKWGNASDGRFAPWGFTAIYLTTAAYAIWGVTLALRGSSLAWTQNLPLRGLRTLVGIVILLNTVVVFGRRPDDAGYYTNLGARRWAETGVLPYGDLKLQGPTAPGYGAAATYGPLLYASHLPAQWLLRTKSNPADADPMDPSYVRRRSRQHSSPVLRSSSWGWEHCSPWSGISGVRRLGGRSGSMPRAICDGPWRGRVRRRRACLHLPHRPGLGAALGVHVPEATRALRRAPRCSGRRALLPTLRVPRLVGVAGVAEGRGHAVRAGFVGTGLAIAILVIAFTPAPKGLTPSPCSSRAPSNIKRVSGSANTAPARSGFGAPTRASRPSGRPAVGNIIPAQAVVPGIRCLLSGSILPGAGSVSGAAGRTHGGAHGRGPALENARGGQLCGVVSAVLDRRHSVPRPPQFH